jgi:hypothetical protein
MKDYRVVLFRNGKISRVFFEHDNEEYVLKCWNDLNESLPDYKFPRKYDNPPSQPLIFELALIYPKNTKKLLKKEIYIKKDSLGRNIKIDFSKKHFIKDMLQIYFQEEHIYDGNSKSHLYYDEFIENIKNIPNDTIVNITKLNIRIFVEYDNYLNSYSLKNLKDSSRFFNLIKNDLISNGNCFFFEDTTKTIKKTFYEYFHQKGFSHPYLFRHYIR